jgi:hypothetical protein
MEREKPAAKRSSPYQRPIAYDREIVIQICRRIINREDLQKICSSPGMPIAQLFLGWIEDHKEAREIYRSACNLESDRVLAKELDIPAPLIGVSDWEDCVRANLKRGWPADLSDRKYIPADWNKVYPKLGAGPPVWSSENRAAYDALINQFTATIQPRDFIELMLTKEATDAAWEARRIAREKGALPEWKYLQRLRVLDTAQSRAIKRRDHALRQIERWRAGLGAKSCRLPDQFLSEELLAEHYGVDPSLDDAESNATSVEAEEAAPRLAADRRTADPAAHPRAHAQEAAQTATRHASLAGEVTQESATPRVHLVCRGRPAAPLADLDEVAETTRPPAPSGGDPMEAVPTLTPRSEAPLLAAQSEAAIPAAVEGPI